MSTSINVVDANECNYDYVIFKVYYKYGETETKICNSFYSLFKIIVESADSFIGEYLSAKEYLKEYLEEIDAEDEDEDEFTVNTKKILIEYEPMYTKYKHLYFFEKRNEEDITFEDFVDKHYSIFTSTIVNNEKNKDDIEKELIEDVLFFNTFLSENCEGWSIKSIIKNQKQKYTSFE